MNYRFILHKNSCSACAACQIGCTDLHNEDPSGTRPGCRRILHLETGSEQGSAEHTYGSVGCMHCRDAACMQACPMNCIRRDPETGFVVCDSSSCIGCRRCQTACPWQIPQFFEGKMFKCDGCYSRVKQGLPPACVKACPVGALDCVPETAYRAAEDALPELMDSLR